MGKSRKAFEHEMSMGGCSIGLREGHGYLDPGVDSKWQMWQASRKQALEEAAQVADRTSNSGRLLLTAGEMRTAKAILSYMGRAIRSLEGSATKEPTCDKTK